MRNRFYNAVAIVDPGACNPSAVINSMAEACAEMRAAGYGTAAICSDPALRLMVHQLAHLANVRELDESLSAYGEALATCRASQNA